MTDAERGLLSVLARADAPLPPGYVGQSFWADRPARNGLPKAQLRFPQAYARPAGRVLKRLREAGLAAVAPHEHNPKWTGWVITAKGRAALDAKGGG